MKFFILLKANLFQEGRGNWASRHHRCWRYEQPQNNNCKIENWRELHEDVRNRQKIIWNNHFKDTDSLYYE